MKLPQITFIAIYFVILLTLTKSSFLPKITSQNTQKEEDSPQILKQNEVTTLLSFKQAFNMNQNLEILSLNNHQTLIALDQLGTNGEQIFIWKQQTINQTIEKIQTITLQANQTTTQIKFQHPNQQFPILISLVQDLRCKEQEIHKYDALTGKKLFSFQLPSNYGFFSTFSLNSLQPNSIYLSSDKNPYCKTSNFDLTEKQASQIFQFNFNSNQLTEILSLNQDVSRIKKIIPNDEKTITIQGEYIATSSSKVSFENRYIQFNLSLKSNQIPEFNLNYLQNLTIFESKYEVNREQQKDQFIYEEFSLYDNPRQSAIRNETALKQNTTFTCENLKPLTISEIKTPQNSKENIQNYEFSIENYQTWWKKVENSVQKQEQIQKTEEQKAKEQNKKQDIPNNIFQQDGELIAQFGAEIEKILQNYDGETSIQSKICEKYYHLEKTTKNQYNVSKKIVSSSSSTTKVQLTQSEQVLKTFNLQQKEEKFHINSKSESHLFPFNNPRYLLAQLSNEKQDFFQDYNHTISIYDSIDHKFLNFQLQEKNVKHCKPLITKNSGNFQFFCQLKSGQYALYNLDLNRSPLFHIKPLYTQRVDSSLHGNDIELHFIKQNIYFLENYQINSGYQFMISQDISYSNFGNLVIRRIETDIEKKIEEEKREKEDLIGLFSLEKQQDCMEFDINKVKGEFSEKQFLFLTQNVYNLDHFETQCLKLDLQNLKMKEFYFYFDHLVRVLGVFKNLKLLDLNLSQIPAISHAIKVQLVKKIGENLFNLVSLSLNFSNSGVIGKLNPNHKHDGQNIQNLYSKLTSLTHLNLNLSFTTIEFDLNYPQILYILKGNTILNLSIFFIIIIFLGALSLKSLQLDLSFLQQVQLLDSQSFLFGSINGLKSLENLDLNFRRSIPYSYHGSSLGSMFVGLSKLKSVKVDIGYMLLDGEAFYENSIDSLSTYCKNLEVLDLYIGFQNWNYGMFTHFTEKWRLLPLLETLYIYDAYTYSKDPKKILSLMKNLLPKVDTKYQQAPF